MDKGLFIQAITKFFLGAVVTALLLFLPAGGLNYSNGWLLMGILFIPMFLAGIVMMCKTPDLLRKRLRAKEKQEEQKQVILLSGLMFIAGFVSCGLNHRFQWCVQPKWLTAVSSIVFLLGYLLYAQVLRENVYLSRTIEVQQGQRVIDTGLYGVVRHPMYMATLLLFCSMPLVLGSPVSLVFFLCYPFLIVKRIRNEEQVLLQELEGYADYQKRVKYRLLPYIW